MAEQSRWKVGDTARYLIKNPFPGAKALVTVERYGRSGQLGGDPGDQYAGYRGPGQARLPAGVLPFGGRGLPPRRKTSRPRPGRSRQAKLSHGLCKRASVRSLQGNRRHGDHRSGSLQAQEHGQGRDPDRPRETRRGGRIAKSPSRWWTSRSWR